MQRNDPEIPVTLEARDFERPLAGGLAPIDAAIEVVRSDCPKEWARYCDLAHQLVQPKQPTEISKEEAGRKLLAANSKLPQSHLISWGNKPTPLTELAAEARNLEGQFRHRLLLALQHGRYFLHAFRGLEPRTVSPELIKPRDFRFESKEMELNGTKLAAVRFVRAEAVPASQSDPPGRKPGQQSAKDRICRIALSILNNEAQRPPPGHGRKAALARMVGARLQESGKTYMENTIARFIRGTVKDWEKNNPDR
jgi:hypothetical protein